MLNSTQAKITHSDHLFERFTKRLEGKQSIASEKILLRTFLPKRVNAEHQYRASKLPLLNQAQMVKTLDVRFERPAPPFPVARRYEGKQRERASRKEAGQVFASSLSVKLDKYFCIDAAAFTPRSDWRKRQFNFPGPHAAPRRIEISFAPRGITQAVSEKQATYSKRVESSPLELGKLNHERAGLLRLKYKGKLNAEENARLREIEAILTMHSKQKVALKQVSAEYREQQSTLLLVKQLVAALEKNLAYGDSTQEAKTS